MDMLTGGLVEYIDHYGNDLRVVNTARVSMGKRKETKDASDDKLIGYLADHEHFSPFRHCFLTMHMRMPIFVERQVTKHRMGVEINSISGRYVEFQEDFYIPEVFRQGSKKIKQGSLDTEILQAAYARTVYLNTCKDAFKSYQALLETGVCKEQARMLLPLSTWTEMIVTMSLQAMAHFYHLRADTHAQREIQPYAHAISKLCYEHFPEFLGIVDSQRCGSKSY